ncbi:MAG: tetratricopeptide repeat protein [Alphaproteobacteria bacterium]
MTDATAAAPDPAIEPGLQGRILLAAAIELHKRGQIDAAIAEYGRALGYRPDLVEAYNNLGVALRGQGKLPAAIACYRRSARLRPGHPPTLSNLANALRAAGEIEEAVALLSEAFAADPASSEIAGNLALALRDLGRVEESLSLFDRSLALRPDRPIVHVERGAARMIAGDLPGAFADLEWRFRQMPASARNGSLPQWDGRPLGGRHLLLWAEDSVEDAIQYARYVPAVAARGARVVIEAPDVLIPLLETVDGVSRVARRGERLPEIAAQAAIASLGRILGSTLETIPASVPYLRPPRRRSPIAVPAGVRCRIGLVWASVVGGRDASCPLPALLELAGRADVAFFALQRGGAAAELARAGADPLVRDLGPDLADLSDLAAAIAEMDLVVTTDGPAAHLAGALDRPAWVLLPWAPDARWMLGRDDSPWYPNTRLFRQPRPGDWASPVREARLALDAALGGA